jgi:hypothetical protein
MENRLEEPSNGVYIGEKEQEETRARTTSKNNEPLRHFFQAGYPRQRPPVACIHSHKRALSHEVISEAADTSHDSGTGPEVFEVGDARAICALGWPVPALLRCRLV